MSRQSFARLRWRHNANSSANGVVSGVAPAEGSRDAVGFDSRLIMIVIVYTLAPVMAGLDTTIVNVAQRTFVDVFASTQAVVGWTVSAYSLSLAAVIPLTGWAANRFGTKRLALGAVLLFTLGSLLCAMAPNIGLLIAFRAVQGVGGGILMPLTFTILSHEAGPARLGRALAIGGIPMFIAPTCGPILGGWLIDSFGWQSIFLINVPIGVLTLLLAAVVLPDDEPVPAESLDVVGLALLPPGLVALLYGISVLPGSGSAHNPRAYLPIAVGVVLIAAFVLHALHRADNPLIDLRLLKRRSVASANGTRFLYAASFFGICLLLPGYFQQVLNKTPLQSGLLLLPQTVAAAVVIPLVGRLTEKRGPRNVVLAGLACIIAGMGLFIYGITREDVPMPLLMAGLAVFGLGSGCSMIPVAWSAVHSLHGREVAHGSTLYNVNHNAAAAIGAALVSVLLTSLTDRGLKQKPGRQGHSIGGEATRHGWVPDMSNPLPTDVIEQVTREVANAYAVVFTVALALVAVAFLPAWFLPNSSADEHRGDAPA